MLNLKEKSRDLANEAKKERLVKRIKVLQKKLKRVSKAKILPTGK